MSDYITATANYFILVNMVVGLILIETYGQLCTKKLARFDVFMLLFSFTFHFSDDFFSLPIV